MNPLFLQRYIREKTTAQHYHAYLFGWIKTYYTAITIYATIAKESTTIVIESRTIFSIFHLTVNINRIL
jgi:hypothetical protein